MGFFVLIPLEVLAAGEGHIPDWLNLPPAHTHAELGRTPTITRASKRGLEATMPRDGTYARAIALDVEGRHAEALREYTVALATLKGMLGTAHGRAEMAWREKIVWQCQTTEELLEKRAFATVMPLSAMAHFHVGMAYHKKFLATRAFLGRGPRWMWVRARAEYEAAVALDRRYFVARIALATLLAQGGFPAAARGRFAEVGRQRHNDDVALHVAAYYAAIGERDTAFRFLERAARQKEPRQSAHRGNDFDALRDDPRWTSLIPPPE